MIAERMVTNLFTIDVEDYFHVTSFEEDIPRGAWDGLECRVERNTDRCLTLLSEYKVRATFFVLGWVAKRYPGLIRRIADGGHEVASHGWGHERVYAMGRDLFREDVHRARETLQDSSGDEVIGYRAPSFSLTRETDWAWEILAEEGHRYDSSVFPVVHDRYGDPDAPRWPHRRVESDGPGGIVEFPLTTLRLFGTNIPVAGGGYLRLLPPVLTHLGIRQANRLGHPAVVYIHPWELDPGQPRVRTRLSNRIRHYTNLSRVESRLRRLLSTYPFGPVRDALGSYNGSGG